MSVVPKFTLLFILALAAIGGHDIWRKAISAKVTELMAAK